MRGYTSLIVVCALVLASVADAGAPRRSIRPEHRTSPVSMTTRASPAPVIIGYDADIRPRARIGAGGGEGGADDPAALIAALSRAERLATPALATTPPVYRSPRPAIRPADLRRPVRAVQPVQPVRVASVAPTTIGRSGKVCNDPRIQGEVLEPITGARSGCGISAPVRITSVAGVTLSQQAIMDCRTAQTLTDWVSSSLTPVLRNRGGGVAALQVPSHYSCRTRNSQKGAKISEHGKGHAIDISAFVLKDGSRISVLDGWRDRRDRKVLERLHASACGPFGTVLGPESDRFHQDHFHFDTARYRSGSYCR
ncbi:MAG: extensin family protein [Rhodobacteraceae bacterium]|nr:extensin family protein [Paracoccaceae bacterium]